MMLPFYMPKMVNSAGLLIDIIGAYLLLRYTLSEEISRTGDVFLALESKNEADIDKAKKYDRRALAGFSLLILGFALQLLSNWL